MVGLPGSARACPVGTRRRGLARLPALLALLLLGAVALAAPAGALADDDKLEQCRNGDFGSPATCTGSRWSTGDLSGSNSHYRENDPVPLRYVWTDLSPGSTHTFDIDYDFTDGGVHAYDYLTSYDRTETTADPCESRSPTAAPGWRRTSW